MSAVSYRKVVLWRFEAADEWWTATRESSAVFVEECRKNGQEDSHVSGEFVFRDGHWKIDEDWQRQWELYRSFETVKAVEEFLDEHGPPPEEK